MYLFYGKFMVFYKKWKITKCNMFEIKDYR